MAKITAKPKPPALGYFADWIRPLRLGDELATRAGQPAGAGTIHEAPMSCHPSPVETWRSEAATDHDDRFSGPPVIGGLRLRRVLDDTAGSRLPRRRGMGGGI